MIPLITQRKLDELADIYGKRLLDQVREVFSQPAYHNSGELQDSLRVSVSKCTDTEPPVIVLSYAEQGFYLGYKSPQWTQLPNIGKLMKWGDLKTFPIGDIPGYTYGTAPALTEEKKISRIVWAIAKNKRKEDTWKQRKWKNAAGLSDLLRDLNSATLTSFAADVEKILAEAISEGTVLS